MGGGEVGEGEWSSERWKRGRRGKSIMDPERLRQDQFGGGEDRGSVWGHVECMRAWGCVAVGKAWVWSLGKGASESWWKW